MVASAIGQFNADPSLGNHAAGNLATGSGRSRVECTVVGSAIDPATPSDTHIVIIAQNLAER